MTLGAELDHEPLSRSETIDFVAVMDSALRFAPEQLAAESRQAQTNLYQEVGSSWFAGAPTLETSFYDDKALTSVGLRELEAGLRLPLWQWGQRGMAQDLGRHFQDLTDAWNANLALAVAGRVRANLADLQEADAMLDLEAEATAATASLLDLTQTLFAIGEVPRLDVMQAQSLLLEQQRMQYEAEGALVDAEWEYQILTGLSVRPQDNYRERQSGESEIDMTHPMLRFMQATLEVARSRVDQAQHENATNPTLGFGVRRERAGRMDDYIDSLSVSLSIPIGRSQRVATAVSGARRDVADVEVALRRARQQLESTLHEAEHSLYVVRQQLEVSRTRATLAGERLQMSRSAYELGEADLLSVTAALQEAVRSRQGLRELELREQRLISDYNQSLGIMP